MSTLAHRQKKSLWGNNFFRNFLKFLKGLICYKRNDEEFIDDTAYLFIVRNLLHGIQVSSIDDYISVIRTPGKWAFHLGAISKAREGGLKLALSARLVYSFSSLGVTKSLFILFQSSII